MEQEQVLDVTHLFPKENLTATRNISNRAEVIHIESKFSQPVTDNELCKTAISSLQGSVAALALLKLPKKGEEKDAKV